jgi:glycosyltransferase involved in cell wall biosynthesis
LPKTRIELTKVSQLPGWQVAAKSRRQALDANSRTGSSQAAPRFDCAVVIPLFNKGVYIERALASVASQSTRPTEILVIDDGSTDDGPAKVAALAGRDPSIRLIRQANAGVSAARNAGIRATKCEWVAFLDADDAYLPWFLEEIKELTRQCPEARLVGTSFKEVPPEFNLELFSGPDNTTGFRRGLVANFYDRWWRGSFFFTSSVCVRRDALDAMGEPFRASKRYDEDLDLFYRMVESGPVAATSRVSSLYAVGVPDSLMSRGTWSEPSPAFYGLLARVGQHGFPEAERAGARRCLATCWTTYARAEIKRGELASAWNLMQHPVTIHRPVYWLRTAGLLAIALAKRAAAGGQSFRHGKRGL